MIHSWPGVFVCTTQSGEARSANGGSRWIEFGLGVGSAPYVGAFVAPRG